MPTKGGARRAAKKIPLTPKHVVVQKKPVIEAVSPPEPEKPVGNRWSYWLVQRMIPRVDITRPGVSKYFRFDDMGYAEFEYGNIPLCLQEIRNTGKLEIVTAEVCCKGKTLAVYFIGPSDNMDQCIIDLQAWLDEGRLSKGYTEFGFHFAGDYSGRLAEHRRTRAWLSLRNLVFFTLEKQYAEQILDGLNNPPKPKTT
jgi:hypothetical protein